MNSVRTAVLSSPRRDAMSRRRYWKGKNCGGPASSFILCVQKKLGYWRFRRFEVDAGRRGDTRRRVYRPESDPRALSGESGERQSLQPLVSSLAERDIYRRQRRRRFPPERRGTGMVANARHTAKAATGARCAMGGLRYRYRAENYGAADGVDAVCRSRRCANGGVSSLYRPRRREPLLAGGIRRAACVSGKRG